MYYGSHLLHGYVATHCNTNSSSVQGIVCAASMVAIATRMFSLIGHIHPGNVMIDKGTAKLVDIENSLIGQPSLYRHHLWEIRKIYVRKNSSYE